MWWTCILKSNLHFSNEKTEEEEQEEEVMSEGNT
jgi:hypothetical protein